MRLILLIFLFSSVSSLAAATKEIKKEKTVTLKCTAMVCPDMVGYDGPCGAGWVINGNEVPPVSAVGPLPECKCTPKMCVPNEPIRAVGFFENDPSFPDDMNVRRFKVKVVSKK